MTIIPIVIGILVLSLIILTHELGHFITAKLSGVKVEEFGMGFPPRLASLKRGETSYSINAIPFGGFTKLSGEEDPNVPGSLAGKSRGTRLLVLGAGSLMNIFLALMLFSVGYLFPRPAAVGQVEVAGIAPDSPAATAGIETGDIILSVNEQPVDNADILHQYIIDNLGKETTLLIQSQGSTARDVRLIPRVEPPKDEGAIGIAIRTVKRYPLWQVIPMGAAELFNSVVIWGSGLVSLFTGETTGSFLGPVGLVQLTGEVAQFGPVPLLQLAALISLILGIMNLLPLPAIDGGRITFLFLEWVRRGKRVSPKAEGIVHLVGVGLLLFFLLAITIQDIMRIFSGNSVIP
ncbi:RIP metalloprotease [Chloroflexota bacterium]